MRYEKRFANGFWRAFDTISYNTVAIYTTQVECDARVAEMNKPK